MNMINYNNKQPIIIGLAGKAGSGKTSVAESIVPKGSLETTKYGIKWDHIFYALPLYEMASIKKNIKGHNEKNRKLYAIHDVLFDLYGRSTLGDIPDYETMCSMVNEIYQMDIESEGTKPRSFLQKSGDICRQSAPDCFARWAIMKSSRAYRDYVRQIPEGQDYNPMAIIVSDVRCKNEAEHILKQPNGFIVCYEASKETLDGRLVKRDGVLMDETHSSHYTENGIEDIKSIASLTIDTNNMTLEEQTKETLIKLNISKELQDA